MAMRRTANSRLSVLSLLLLVCFLPVREAKGVRLFREAEDEGEDENDRKRQWSSRIRTCLA